MALVNEAQRYVRPPALSPEQVAEAHQLADLGVPLSQIARRFGVARSTLYRALGREFGIYNGAEIASMKLELERLRAWQNQVRAEFGERVGS